MIGRDTMTNLTFRGARFPVIGGLADEYEASFSHAMERVAKCFGAAGNLPFHLLGYPFVPSTKPDFSGGHADLAFRRTPFPAAAIHLWPLVLANITPGEQALAEARTGPMHNQTSTATILIEIHLKLRDASQDHHRSVPCPHAMIAVVVDHTALVNLQHGTVIRARPEVVTTCFLHQQASLEDC
jgi:hypothetical protein